MNDRIFLVKAKSLVRFYEVQGKSITLDEALESVKSDYQRNIPNYKKETWIDISTGKEVKGQF